MRSLDIADKPRYVGTLGSLIIHVDRPNVFQVKRASFIVSAKPLPPTSRGSSAGSSNLGTSLYPAHKARDLGEVVLSETMHEAEKSGVW